MPTLKHLSRLYQIKCVLLRHGVDELLPSTPWTRRLRYLGFYPKKHDTLRGVRLREALQILGPIFVKFGQMLSTRRDLLPVDIADELALLQDQVPPFNDAHLIIEQALGRPLQEIFASFDHAPLAAASVAQVHAATLFTGQDVVVKVLRPGIEADIRRDIELMHMLARWLRKYVPKARRFKPQEVVVDYEKTIFGELDLLLEAANASQLRRNFIDSPLLYVPNIYWDYCRENVLVMERIYGVPVSDIATLKANKVNLKKLAEHGVEIFFTQVFRDSFFHADMHPGNIFVGIEDPENPIYRGVDFGIMGSLSKRDQRYLAENFLAFFNRDYRRIAELHLASGWVPKDTRVEEFEFAIRAVCEPIFGKPLREISFAQFLLRLFETARRFHMEVQPQLILLQKTLFYVEGLGKQLYPDLDLWQTAKPFLERWLRHQLSPRTVLRKLRQQLPYWAEKLPELPMLIFNLLEKKRDAL